MAPRTDDSFFRYRWQAFEHPAQVVAFPDLGLDEKRAILIPGPPIRALSRGIRHLKKN